MGASIRSGGSGSLSLTGYESGGLGKGASFRVEVELQWSWDSRRPIYYSGGSIYARGWVLGRTAFERRWYL